MLNSLNLRPGQMKMRRVFFFLCVLYFTLCFPSLEAAVFPGMLISCEFQTWIQTDIMGFNWCHVPSMVHSPVASLKKMIKSESNKQILKMTTSNSNLQLAKC